jgi:hypothetical protein
MSTNAQHATKNVYWHRELPPLCADLMGEHVIEAVSGRVPSTLSHRDEVWDRCYAELMNAVQVRLTQEIVRLGGDCAHVLREAIDTRHDERSGETWLRGRFTYMLYRLPHVNAEGAHQTDVSRATPMAS